MTHICVGKLTIIGSENGLSPFWRQVIIWTNAGILLIGPLGRNFCEILIRINTFSFRKSHFSMSSGKWRPFCLGLSAQCIFLYFLITVFYGRLVVVYCFLTGSFPSSLNPMLWGISLGLGHFSDLTWASWCLKSLMYRWVNARKM